MAGFTKVHKTIFLSAFCDSRLVEAPFYTQLEVSILRDLINRLQHTKGSSIYVFPESIKGCSKQFKESVWFEPSNSRSKGMYVYQESLPILITIIEAYDQPISLEFPTGVYCLPATIGALRWFGAKMGLTRKEMNKTRSCVIMGEESSD